MKTSILGLFALILTGCATPVRQDAHYEFVRNLLKLCGGAYEGRIVSPPVEADANFAGKKLILYSPGCTNLSLWLSLQAGEDRSRLWNVGMLRGFSGVKLEHFHTHADGTEDKLSRYGGRTVAEGTATRQEFPADAFSKKLFVQEGIPASAANVWAMEIVPGKMFAYELRRSGRFFRVEFDLTKPVATPPPPWGRPVPIM